MSALCGAAERGAATAQPLHELLARRWSPRSYDPAHEIGEDALTALLEAARWAPSAQNRQPWRFVAGRRGTPLHELLARLPNERNQVWAPRASALILGLVERVGEDGARQRFAEYDLGQAVAQLTLQARHLGLHVRQMGGFDADAAGALVAERRERSRPGGPALEPLVLVAVGRATPEAALEPAFRERDTAPRRRRGLDEVVIDRS